MRRHAAVALALTVLVGCGDDGGNGSAGSLTLELTGVEPLQNGFHYEGWAIIDGQPHTTGKFNVTMEGALTTVDGTAIPDGEFMTDLDLAGAEAIVITIEPSGDADEAPAATKLMAGPVSAGEADLVVGASDALGDDYTSASGSFILATPTDGMDNNERSGVWFLMPADPPTASLDLPALPQGWRFEGWVVIDEMPVTTGRFVAVDSADLADPFSGPMPGPPFPGEDFVENAPDGLTFPTDIAGLPVVITIEPDPDDSPAPFTLKPLIGMSPDDAADHTSYPLDNAAADFPTGRATIR